MNKGYFITGTGTDVGKTFVTGLLLKTLNEKGINVGYYKAAMSGNARREDGSLIPGDALFVKETAGLSQPLEEMCPYVYEHAYSPHLASQIEGGSVQMSVVKAGYEQACNKYDYVFVEGSGGILCPINFDLKAINKDKQEANNIIMLEDVIKELELSSIIVADAGLGTINALVLTVQYMKAKGLPIEGIIYNNYVPGDVMHEDNIAMCEYMTGEKTIAKITKDMDSCSFDLVL